MYVYCLSTGQNLSKSNQRGFHEKNYYTQTMKPYETGYLNQANLTAPFGLAWSQDHVSSTLPNCAVSGQERQFSRISDWIHGQCEIGIPLQALATIHVEKGFVAVQKRLNGEALEEYIKPVGGGYFFALPGVIDQQKYLGQDLLEA